MISTRLRCIRAWWKSSKAYMYVGCLLDQFYYEINTKIQGLQIVLESWDTMVHVCLIEHVTCTEGKSSCLIAKTSNDIQNDHEFKYTCTLDDFNQTLTAELLWARVALFCSFLNMT